jgi:tetratricopeptide (TPR) repeat protein
MSYKKKGDYDQAEKFFQRVINVDSDNKMALFELKLIRGQKEGTDQKVG